MIGLVVQVVGNDRREDFGAPEWEQLLGLVQDTNPSKNEIKLKLN